MIKQLLPYELTKFVENALCMDRNTTTFKRMNCCALQFHHVGFQASLLYLL